ncbi:hypothetical protein ACFYPA_28575 [Streptomyces sp. NPDC005775]|uniref:hypothetical protein n=1 Tax=Streptomyces sp. NPDC005775 TaxID=3364729 RepID=UPI00367DA444
MTFTDPLLCAAIVDRLTFGGTIIETGTDSYSAGSTSAAETRHQTLFVTAYEANRLKGYIGPRHSVIGRFSGPHHRPPPPNSAVAFPSRLRPAPRSFHRPLRVARPTWPPGAAEPVTGTGPAKPKVRTVTPSRNRPRNGRGTGMPAEIPGS